MNVKILMNLVETSLMHISKLDIVQVVKYDIDRQINDQKKLEAISICKFMIHLLDTRLMDPVSDEGKLSLTTCKKEISKVISYYKISYVN